MSDFLDEYGDLYVDFEPGDGRGIAPVSVVDFGLGGFGEPELSYFFVVGVPALDGGDGAGVVVGEVDFGDAIGFGVEEDVSDDAVGGDGEPFFAVCDVWGDDVFGGAVEDSEGAAEELGAQGAAFAVGHGVVTFAVAFEEATLVGGKEPGVGEFAPIVGEGVGSGLDGAGFPD